VITITVNYKYMITTVFNSSDSYLIKLNYNNLTSFGTGDYQYHIEDIVLKDITKFTDMDKIFA